MKIFLAQQPSTFLLRIISCTLLCIMLLPLPTLAQQRSLLEKNLTIDFASIKISQALQQIEQQINCSFVYSNQLLDADRKVTKRYRNEKLERLLTDLFAGKKIKLKQDGKQVFIGLQSERKQRVYGRITSSEGPLAGVSVRFGQQSTTTDQHGRYELSALAEREYLLRLSSVGYKTISQTVFLKESSPLVVNLTLQSDAQQLQQVDVDAKTASQLVRETGFNVAALELSKYNNSTRDVNQILNTTTGVRIREYGGLGSDFNFSLNGLSGKAIRFFIDGIPMENFGIGMNFNNIPVNLADRLEVYKGVVPIELGSDALGGGINMVTNKGAKNYLDASYSIGSFNTHRLSLNTQSVNDTTGLMFKLTGFYNYSDNDYWMHSNPKYDAAIRVPDGPNSFIEKSVKRFHDQYKSGMIQAEAGYINQTWADALVLGMLYNNHYKEFQTGNNQNIVYGKVNRHGNYFMPSLRYKKDNLFIEGLNATAFVSYAVDKYSVVDTSTTTYWWDGSASSSNNDFGELNRSKNRSYTNYQNTFLLTRVNLSYRINEGNQLILNHNYNKSDQKSDEELSQKILSPAGQSKSVTGLSWQNKSLQQRLNTSVFAKFFHFGIELGAVTEGKNPMPAQHRSYNNFGYGLASRYSMGDNMGVKFSYEHAYRLPELVEVLGDGVNVIPNPDIKPESSHNFNINADLSRKHDRHFYSADIGGFLRNAKDFIYTIPMGNNTSQFLNEGKVIVYGAEAEVQYKYAKLVELTLNASYQRSKQNQKYTYGTETPRANYGNMIPNQPWLYGNLYLSVGKSDWLGRGTRLQFDWSSQYYHSFYLTWEAWGSSQSLNIIPTQLLHHAGMTYSLKDGRYNISFECRNLGNELAYDNFRLQKPGRSFNLKLRYFLH